MAKSMETTQPLQQTLSAFMDQENLTVLNAVSNLTVQRTIVEAFVKLVVCRKVTVQKVAVVSGHILDSHTTQEEDSPVILDVHRHETGDAYSTLGSSLMSSTSSHAHQKQRMSQSSSSQANSTTKCKESAFQINYLHDADLSGSKEKDYNKTCCVQEISTPSNFPKKNVSCNNNKGGIQKSFSSGSIQKLFHANDNNQKEKQSVSKRNSQECFRIEHDINTSQSLNHPSKKMKLNEAADMFLQEAEKSRIASQKNPQSSDSKILKNNGKDEIQQEQNSNFTDDEDDFDPNFVNNANKDSYEEKDENCSPLTEQVAEVEDVNKARVEKIHRSIEVPADGLVDPQQSTISELKLAENCEFSRRETMTDGFANTVTEETETDIISDDKQSACKQNDEFVTEFADKEENLSPHKQTPLKITEEAFSPQNSNTSRIGKNGSICLEQDDDDQILISEHKSLEAKFDDTVNHSQAAEKSSLNERSLKSQKNNNVTGTEEDLDPDMLVIDISCAVAEQTTQPADVEDNISPGQELQKLDPFAHLFETSFPPLDRIHDKTAVTHSKDSKTLQETCRNDTEMSETLTVKEEPDDDCMITAAFMSPAGKKRGRRPRSASYTITNESSLESAGEWDQSSVLHQFFHQTARGPQVGKNAAAVFQSPAGHSNTSLTATNSQATPQSFMPNFLASTSQPSEQMSVSSESEEGSSAIDYSQRTYQCALCCKIFLHRHKYDLHMMICGGHRPFKCKICSKGFNQRAHLDTHMKFHIGIKRYRCDLCRKAYVMKGDLIRHLKTRVHRQAMQTHGLLL